MTTFILVHGSFHGGWCWDKVTPLLEAAGHRAMAPDLPGMGKDTTPLGEVTLNSWARCIVDLSKQAGEKVVLVGHSRGGGVIGEASEMAPELVRGLIYVTALLFPGGTTAMAALQAGAGHVSSGVIPNADGVSMSMTSDAARALLFNKSAADADAAIPLLCPEPIAPNLSPLSVTESRWGSLPRAYIECSLDATLPLSYQREMQAVLPCNPVVTMESDHSPFLCAPEVLARHLIEIADTFELESR